ncbi:MerR family transcriptional regulator [Streptomonospora litoralis]|uniref:MerR family regulatory protein n=1 Tax=Streptomonospora litoralis TaxID=2498135 RepID=A0A4P6PZ22_9ACTN|nr:MerR family transcriptional regulator [Streptomonospora litoralis]QBI52980.1 MerR family regulatory protein [Streptomonospora litoralis]
MQISELSRRSGVPVATIKYYLRENLLPKGEAVSATQARYTEDHLRRLRLVRALVEVAEVPLARIRPVLDTLDDPQTDLHTLLGTAIYTLSSAPEEPEDDPQWDRAQRQSSELLAKLGWRVTPASPARVRLTQALTAMERLGYPASEEMLRAYAAAAHRVAESDLDYIDPQAAREEALMCAVALSAFMEQTLTSLRRLAQEDESARRFGHGGHADGPSDRGAGAGNGDGGAADG